MKANKIIFLLSIIMSLTAQAEPFEIYGLKSGMTKAEFLK